MPYNPGVQDRRGEILAQGISQFGANLADGIKGYGQLKRQDAALTGLIEAFGARLPKLAETMSEDNQKRVEKFLSGKATLDDKTALAGSLQAAQKIQEEEQQRQARELALAQAKQQQETLARMKALGQFSQGAGTGVLRPEVQQQMRGQLNDPVTRFSAQTAQATGQLPSSRDIVDVHQMQTKAAAATQPIIAASIEDLEKKYPSEKFDYKIAELADGRVAIPDGIVNTRAPRQQTEAQPFQMGTSMGDKTGRYLGVVTFDQRSGKAQLETPGGKRTDIPPDARPITATSTQRHVPSIHEFRKFKADVTDAEISLRAMDRYMDSVENSDVGLQRLANQFTIGIKTLMGGKDPLNLREIAQNAAQGQLQGLLGSNRTNVVGGGVMTEQDAIRVIQRLGGDVTALQNPEVVKKAIAELYSDRYQQYNDDLLFFNNAVDDYYGERGHKKVAPTRFNPKLLQSVGVVVAPDEAPVAPGAQAIEPIPGLTMEETKRLNELRAKAGTK